MSTLNRLPNTATADEICASLREHGYVIVDELASKDQMDRIAAEMAPYVDATDFGADHFIGLTTKRTGSMIARSPASRELIMHPSVIGTAERFLDHAAAFQLHLTQIISVHPGSPAQMLHQDELAWDFFPFPEDYQVQCNLLWALSDYTEENGATRIVPNSQFVGRKKKFTDEQSIPAVMKRGSALFYTGKIYHGAGTNRSDSIRQAINITYAVGWVRQEENQYISCPREIAQTLPDDLLKVMGYQYGCFALGYTGDFKDPLTALRENVNEVTMGLNLLEGQRSDSGVAFRKNVQVESA